MAKKTNSTPLHQYLLPDVEVSEIDLAYIAGLLDGDGSFLIRKRSGERGYCMQVVYPKYHRETIEYVSNLFEGNAKDVNRSAGKAVYMVTFSSRKAYRLLSQIYPLLRIKKRAAQICMRFLEQYWRPGRTTPVDIDRDNIGAFHASLLKKEHTKSWPRRRPPR